MAADARRLLAQAEAAHPGHIACYHSFPFLYPDMQPRRNRTRVYNIKEL